MPMLQLELEVLGVRFFILFPAMLIMKEIPWTRKHFLSLNFKALEYLGYKLDKKPWTWAQKSRSCMALMGLTLLVGLVVCNIYDIWSNVSKGFVVKGVQSISLPSISITALIAQVHFVVFNEELHTLFGQIDGKF